MTVLFAFGLNEDGQCGCNETNVDRLMPMYIADRPTIIAVSAGSRHTMAVCNEGYVYSWGWGHLGQLGHGDTSNVFSPRKINGLVKIKTISAGGMHSGCVNDKFKCYMWGDNTYGQLGIGIDDFISTPLKNISSPSLMTIKGGGEDEEIDGASRTETIKITKVSCGGMHTAFLDDMGEVYCCGRADSGQTGYAKWYYNFLPSLPLPMHVHGVEVPYTLYRIPYTFIPYTVYLIPYTVYRIPYTVYLIPHTYIFYTNSGSLESFFFSISASRSLCFFTTYYSSIVILR